MVRRTGAHRTYAKDYFEVFKVVFDRALKRSWEASAGTNISAKCWVRRHRASVAVFVPDDILGEIIQEWGNWELVGPQIAVAVKSKIGMALFSEPWLTVSRSMFIESIQPAIETLIHHDFDAASWEELKLVMGKGVAELVEIGHEEYLVVDSAMPFLLNRN